MILEEGTKEQFKDNVLDSVMAWTYTCQHTKVLDLATVARHGGKAVDFGLCEDCKEDEGRKLYALVKEHRRVARNREPIGVEALDPRDFVDAFMQHVQLHANMRMELPE